MREDIKKILETEKDTTIETRGELDGKICCTDYFNNLANDVDTFNKVAWENKTGFDSPNFPSFTKGFEGWSPGFYAFAGGANHGKTAIMLNIMEDLCMNEDNKLFGIYFSLDDSKNKVIPRVVAMRETLPINVIAKPGRYQDMINKGHEETILFQEYLNKRKAGLESLKSDSNKLTVFDSQEIKNWNDLHETVKNIYYYVKSQDEEANIMIGIDSLKDIVLEGNFAKVSVNERVDEIAKRVKDMSIEFNCIVFGSMHLRKLNGNRRPTMDDLKESNTLEYELDCCFLVYNDVSRNKQSAKIFRYNDENDTEKRPVIEIDWAKNKISSYKGVTFVNFSPEYSKCIEVTEQATETYNARLYTI